MSQENLSPGNCVAATVFPKEIKSLPINVATVYPKEIMSPGNTVARMLVIGILYFRQRRAICDERGAKNLNGDIEIRHLNACMYMQV